MIGLLIKWGALILMDTGACMYRLVDKVSCDVDVGLSMALMSPIIDAIR
jgi:hypothetical protein